MQTKKPAVIRDICGTITGHARHRSQKEEHCTPCQTALREHRRQSYKKWNATTKTYRDEWYSTNKEKIRDKRNEYGRKYVQENKEYYRNKCRRRRAQKRNNGFEPYTEEQLFSLYGTICYLCSNKIDLAAPRQVGKVGWEQGLHIDHVIPISKGGSDTLDNVRPTHALCNLSKNDKLIGEPVEDFEVEIDPSLFEDETVELEDLDDLEDFEDDEEEED